MAAGSNRPTILCFGHDPVLLETRWRVIASRYASIPFRSLEEIAAYDGEVDLVVLCHTIQAAEATACQRLVRDRWPGARLLSVSAAAFRSEKEKIGPVVSGLGGPPALLQAVHQALLPQGVQR